MTDKIFTFTAPGRTEIGGNHTDHQRGRVLAAAVNLQSKAEVKLNGKNEVNILSHGYAPVKIDLNDLDIKKEEEGTTAALVRGVLAGFKQRGASLVGFDAEVSSTVLSGSGLSSSASFEVLIGTAVNELCFDKGCTAVEIAQIGQYAENVYFGKPCGLMDQAACAVGGLVYIDFANAEKPDVRRIDFDFENSGYSLCIIDCGADHAALTDEYAAIPQEMCSAARFFGKEVLREVEEESFFSSVPKLREKVGDRAVLRAVHFFEENRRVKAQVKALENGDFNSFLQLVNESGHSSWELLQNIAPCGAKTEQSMAVALALSKHILDGRGAVRVHGGGFAGTIQAYVPNEMLTVFKEKIESILGDGACHTLSVRSLGGVLIEEPRFFSLK